MTLPPRQRETNKRQKAVRCHAHLNFVRSFCCSVPLCQQVPVEAAHVRLGTDGGMGIKPGDQWTISLCAGAQGHHAEQHRIGEASFAKKYGIDLKALAEEFAANSQALKRYYARQNLAGFTPRPTVTIAPPQSTTLRDCRAQRKAK